MSRTLVNELNPATDVLKLFTIFMQNKKKILVTGGAGFIGSHLIDSLLENGHTVVCVDDLSCGRTENINHCLSNSNFKFIQINILERSELDSIFQKHIFDSVFHLVTNPTVHGGVKDPSLDVNKTFLTAFFVLECMRKYSVKEIIFFSSPAVYGERSDGLREDMGPLFPISPLGATKLSAEILISSFSRMYGLQSWIIRPPNVTGERGTHGVVFDFINKLITDKKKLIILGDGKQEKPYIYVRELISGVLFIWENARENFNLFNIAPHDDAVTVLRIAEIVIEEMGLHNVAFEHTPGKGGWLGDVPEYRYDVSKLSQLGWSTSLSSEEAIRIAARRQILFLKSLKSE